MYEFVSNSDIYKSDPVALIKSSSITFIWECAYNYCDKFSESSLETFIDPLIPKP